LSEILVDCAIASGLGTIDEPIIEISQAHNHCGGIIVFQFFRRHAHLCGALPKMNGYRSREFDRNLRWPRENPSEQSRPERDP
jgi:hypothetical protein